MTVKRPAMSLIELITVLAIISLLAQIILPALMYAREAARQSQCQNNLRQLALAALQHETSIEHFPTGGWNWRWIGDAQRGFSSKQPGGWTFNVLPFMESNDIRQWSVASKEHMMSISIEIFYCPSRRQARPYMSTFAERDWQVRNAKRTQMLARTDYAVNGGTKYVNLGAGPISYADFDNAAYNWPSWLSNATGVAYPGSSVKISAIEDGTSKTYLIGEKYLAPAHYQDGSDPGDDGSMYQGDDMDITRWASATITDEYYSVFTEPNSPRRDSNGSMFSYCFGSAHQASWNAAMCDGSVVSRSYSLDSNVHTAFGSVAGSESEQ